MTVTASAFCRIKLMGQMLIAGSVAQVEFTALSIYRLSI